MQTDLLDQIRAACATVSAQAAFVHLDAARIDAYAARLPLDRLAQPEHDAATHFLGYGAETVAFFVTLDSINFGSGYFPHLRKRPGMSGYFTIAASLKDYFTSHGVPSAQQLSALQASDCTALFSQDPSNLPVQELMQLFARALNDLGGCLTGSFGGSYTDFVECAGGEAARLIGQLSQMPLFRDASVYRGMEVPFYKRAQLMAADLALAFGRQAWGRFEDLDRLTIFADNLVPHVLRMDGLLIYETSLAGRIDAEQLIPSGSLEEIEIRATAVHAVEQIGAALRAHGHSITSMQLDYLLWNRGQELYYKRSKPRHRTRTVFY